MKKVLSVVLSAVMVLTTFYCLTLGSIVSAEEQGTPGIINITSSMWYITTGSGQGEQRGKDVTYGNETVTNLDGEKGAQYQAFYVPVTLKANTNYVFEFNALSGVKFENLKIFSQKAGLPAKSGEGLAVDVSLAAFQKIYNTSSFPETALEWTGTTTYSFKTLNDETEYYIFLKAGKLYTDCPTNRAYIKNAVIREVFNTTVAATGNGGAKVSTEMTNAGNTVTYTATPYIDSKFLGWYKEGSDTPVSVESEYTFTAEEDVTLIAKFTGINLLANTKAADWKWKANSSKAEDSNFVINGGKTIRLRDPQYQTVYTTVNLSAGTYKFQASAWGYTKLAALKIFNKNNLAYDSDGNINVDDSANYITAFFGTVDPYASAVLYPKNYAKFTIAEQENYIIAFKFNSRMETDEAKADEYATYISDISLVQYCNVSVSSTGNGGAKVSANEVSSGEAVTFTATPYIDSKFLGWSDGENIVSTEKVYQTEITKNTNLTAIFTDENLLANTKALDWKYKDGSVSKTEDSDYIINGGKTIKIKNPLYQVIYTTVNLSAGTYKFQASAWGYTKLEYLWIFNQNNLAYDSDGNIKVDNNANYIKNSYAVIDPYASAVLYPSNYAEFTVAEQGNYIIAFKFAGRMETDEAKADYYSTYISDISLIKTGGSQISMATFKGNSIRTSGDQALRYRFENVNFEEYYGYSIEKVGVMAIRTKYLGGKELVKDGVYSYQGRNKKATEKTITQNDVAADNTVSLALTGIGVTTKADQTKTTDYSAYGEDYTVRMYAVLKNSSTGEEMTLYTSEYTACIFDVMAAILASDNQTDKDAVNAMLSSDATDKNGYTVSQLYNAYIEQ